MPELERNVILVVDDSPTNLQLLSDSLLNSGFKVILVTSGIQALEILKVELPDLILLDAIMPGIDGFETCRQLKANPLTLDIPVIFMTALADPVDKVKGFNLGAVDYITKPFHEEEILARVRTHLKLRKLTKMLEQQNSILKQMTEELEQRVEDRTAELSKSLQDLKQAQIQLIHSEKMSALGNLVAGVAHEINNPTNFIAGNLQHARENVHKLLRLIQLYQQNFPDPGDKIEIEIAEIELEYLREDLPNIINSMQLGIDTIRNISTSLRTFSRSDKASKVLFDIHQGIESTLLILKHRLKANNKHPEIKIVKNYGNLPLVECFPGQLNQVFMNLLANAIDAIEEVQKNPGLGSRENNLDRINIETVIKNENYIEIRITDSGIGMTEEVKSKAFDDLFTTKPIGKGTGLGLAIARQIVVDRHQGTIELNSTFGKGAEFIISLPIKADRSFV